ncbi:hypothetical protein SAMN05216243_2470 [Sediminibacillus albus]|uniref:Uncharacterized protein n=1 Tax=Sediminibacillus albus TaxID=407036 RepID=A0A1G9A848_9BACI|nr:hypothetical protein SAMN05216243_2470 [Sediminibacillus albus]
MIGERDWNSSAERFHRNDIIETYLGAVRLKTWPFTERYRIKRASVSHGTMPIKVVPRLTPFRPSYSKDEWSFLYAMGLKFKN